jgi:hypothetical protein
MVNGMYAKRLIGYSFIDQALDFLPVFGIAFVPAVLTWSLGGLFSFNNILLLLIQVILYPVLVVLLSVSMKLPAFYEIKQILSDKLTVANFLKTLNRAE